MLSLDFSQESLDVQKSVVIEEFKERYLNQPYGDVWLKILPLAYKVHPYSWPTIGKEISHIENATLDDVKSFFKSFYCPNNAVLVVAGNISLEKCNMLCEKWFAPIPKQQINKPQYQKEPKQTEARKETVYAEVPQDMIVMAYHIPARTDKGYYVADLISDILGAGKSSRLYNALVKKNPMFSELDAYLSGDIDEGLLLIEGKLLPGINMDEAELAITQELNKLKTTDVEDLELQKVKNKSETNILFNDVGSLNKAMKLAYAFVLGDIELVNKEAEHYLSVNQIDIKALAKEIFDLNNCSTLYYRKK
jgi:predicted Zn-dependent peptidase